MPNIVHRIGIEGTAAERVYQAVATRDGIASWTRLHWTKGDNEKCITCSNPNRLSA